MIKIYKLQLFQGIAGLNALKKIWQKLYGNASKTHFFHMHQWYESYITALETHPDAVFFIVVYENKYPRVILPLKKKELKIAGMSITILEVPEHPHLSYKDIIVDNRDNCLNLSQVLLEDNRLSNLIKWDVIRIKNVYESSHAISAFDTLSQRRLYKKQVGTCFFLPLDSFKKNDGQTVKKKQKKMAK